MSKPRTQVIVLLSGGVDSAVVLAEAVNASGSQSVAALTVMYGSLQNAAEKKHAKQLAAYYRVHHKMIALPFIGKFCSGSLIHGGNLTGEATIVPLRNAVFLALAASWAVSLGATRVLCGATGNDAVIYPDCRYPFIDAMDAALYQGSDRAVRVSAPFVHTRKSEVVQLGQKLGVPWAMTYSCYAGNVNQHCGQCGACQERRVAFLAAGVIDPAPLCSPGEANFTSAAPVGRVGDSRDESGKGQTGSPVAPGRGDA